MIHLAQAAPVPPDLTWPSALVVIVMTLVPACVSVAIAILSYLKARDERAAKKVAESERDAVIEGVERAGDNFTKATIKKTAAERGVAGLSGSVERVTKRIAPLLLLGILFFTGCCTVDHDVLAALAERRRRATAEAATLPADQLSLPVAQLILGEEALAWEFTAATLNAAPVSSSTQAWIDAGGLR